MDLEQLRRTITLDFSLDELRIILGCFRAVAYHMEMDDETYLDARSLELKGRLEGLYSGMLKSPQGLRSPPR